MPPPGPARARCGRRRSAPAPRRSSSSTSWSGCGAAARGGCWPRSGAPLDLDALLAALGRVHRLGLVLVDPQRLAVGGLELAVEVLDGALQALDGVVPERLALPDPVEDAFVVAGDVVEELALEATHLGHRDLVELAGGTQPDGDDLALHRVGLVLALLEQLEQTLAALERRAAGGVEVGGEREIGRAHV